MRLLVATTAGAGHLGPMLPLARACLAAGHEVLVAAPASFAGEVARVGLEHAPVADADPSELAAVFGRLPALSHEEADAVVVQEVFGRLDAEAFLPGILEIVDGWRPDVLLRDPAEIASVVAAEVSGVPHVQLAIGMTGFEDRTARLLAEPVGRLAERAGADAERVRSALLTCPRFSCVPPMLEAAGGSRAAATSAGEGPGLSGPLTRYRYDVPPPGAALEPWGDPSAPLVYVTFGSVAASVGPFAGLYPAVLEVLAAAVGPDGGPVRLLMTTGAALDPAALGPLPDHVRVERWWAQHDVLREASAMVGHGGFGTTMGALAAGVPQVVLPLFAGDQFVNAAHVDAAGAGVALIGAAPPVDRLAGALTRVLDEPGLAAAARAVAAEMAALPPVEECVPLLEELAR